MKGFFSFTLSAAQNNRCQPAKPSGCSLFFVLSFYIVLFHLPICRNPSLSTLNSCIVNVKKPFLLQKSLFGHANRKLAVLYCLPQCYQQLMLTFNGEVPGSWCWSCAWFAEECAVRRGGHGHVCPAAGASAVAGPGLGHLVVPVLGRPHVSTSHVEGNEGTCGSVLPCFL